MPIANIIAMWQRNKRHFISNKFLGEWETERNAAGEQSEEISVIDESTYELRRLNNLSSVFRMDIYFSIEQTYKKESH